MTALRDGQEQVIGYLLISTDNTTRKGVELALQETHAALESAKAVAEKASLAKSDFLSSMSHELRSPLNAVLGFAQVLASDEPPPTAEQKVSIDQILHAGWYLLRLINEILDLSMIESGKVTISQESMTLTDVLQDCEAMIVPQAVRRRIRVSFPKVDDLGHVRADRTRLKQVMLNLLSNAIKYNREGGAVVVECAASEPGRVRVSVRDTGVGLSLHQMSQLFQPFNRLGRESGSEEGTGIGLVVTKQLIELMGGSIGVDSAVGIGSVFWVELAVADAPELVFGPSSLADNDDGWPVSAHTATTSSRHTLLYIEDNPANMALVEKLVSRRQDLSLITAVEAQRGLHRGSRCWPCRPMPCRATSSAGCRLASFATSPSPSRWTNSWPRWMRPCARRTIWRCQRSTCHRRPKNDPGH